MERGSGIGRLGSIALVALLLAACGAAPAAARSAGWTLATKRPGAAAAAPAYLGNGYVGTRIPAEGAGYASSPVATETHIAGVYASVPDEVGGGTHYVPQRVLRGRRHRGTRCR